MQLIINSVQRYIFWQMLQSTFLRKSFINYFGTGNSQFNIIFASRISFTFR